MHSSDASEDEISLLDIFIFLKNSRYDIGISTLICLIIGASYYFVAPNKYEATATIQMALVAGQAVEIPQVLIEKVKLPLYFSHKTWDACDTDEELTPSRKVAEKIKPLLNKNAPFVSFSTTAESSKEAIQCLTAVIDDIRANQATQASPLIEQKKSQLATLESKLAQAEEQSKLLTPEKFSLNIKDERFSASALLLATTMSNNTQIKDLTGQINDLKIALADPQTQMTHLPTPIYCPDIPVNKRPLLTLVISLFCGLMFGLVYASAKLAHSRFKAQLTS